MEETTYSVSEAVRLIGVESHVLRYWEEELKIPIGRTSLGHRIYSQKDIEIFTQVRQWKQKGLQLKAIRLLLDKADTDGMGKEFDEQIRSIAYGTESEEREVRGTEKVADREELSDRGASPYTETERGKEEPSDTDRTANRDGASVEHDEDSYDESDYEIIPARTPEGNLEKVVLILKQMMEEVVAEQNKKLEREIAEQLREELESLYLQYIQALREASAAKEQERQKGILRQIIKKWFPGGK